MLITTAASALVLGLVAVGIAVLPWSDAALDQASAAFAALGRGVVSAVSKPRGTRVLPSLPTAKAGVWRAPVV